MLFFFSKVFKSIPFSIIIISLLREHNHLGTKSSINNKQTYVLLLMYRTSEEREVWQISNRQTHMKGGHRQLSEEGILHCLKLINKEKGPEGPLHGWNWMCLPRSCGLISISSLSKLTKSDLGEEDTHCSPPNT